MNYDETRDSEQLRLLTPAIDDFINRFQNHQPGASTCSRRTIFFFPGGMASQLARAKQKFVDNLSAPQTFDYKTVWITMDVLKGAARKLEMYRDNQGVFRDKGDHIIIANGSVNLAGATPHCKFIDWCANNSADLFVFNWDWRRRLDETVNFFVGKFLPFFQERVMAAGCTDPLASLVLVGHSFGGMIVNLILRGNDPAVTNMTHAITVGTPFYGYTGQAHRWFEGDEWVNGPLGVYKKEMIGVITSLPALYVLGLLDGPTYDGNKTDLGSDAKSPLASYPSMDATNGAQRADPYDPQPNGNLVRYPGNLGFNYYELEYAKLLSEKMAGPMDPALLKKFFHIRGVRAVADTAGAVTCGWIPSNFDPFINSSPIVDAPPMPGDNTQPAWTARLVTNDPSRCITVSGSDVSHMFLMNAAETLDAIGTILCGTGATQNSPDDSETATYEEAIQFVRWVNEPENARIKWPALDDPKLFEKLPERFKKNFVGIARRIIMDILKRPAPHRARPRRDTPSGKPATGNPLRSPAAKSKSEAAEAPARRPRANSGNK